MSFFSEERSSELRDLFFESAQELLQALNEAGLELEKRPSDGEIIRTLRRTVHTLKGDSAACGFKELSELAHELEDVLTPEMAARSDRSVAQVVLSAADMFDAMLSAYRGQLQLPDGAPLRQLIHGIADNTAQQFAGTFEPRFAWSEYEQLVIEQAADGRPMFNLGIEIDPQCPFRAAGVQLVRNMLHETGKVLLAVPEDGAAADKVEVIEAVVASDKSADWITRKCRIPAVVRGVLVRPYAAAPASAPPAEPLTPPQPLPAAPGVPEPAAFAIEASAVPTAAEVLAAPVVAVTETEHHETSQPLHTVSENTLRVAAERIDSVLNLVGELIIAKSMLHDTVSEFARRFPKDPLRGRFADMLAHQAQVLNDLQRSVMKIRMVPVEQLFRRFPRVIRDVAKATGKEVRLEMGGQETDLDKTILDALAEPMTHLVRNAVDHGVEPPEVRVAAGKPAQGTVGFNAYHQGNQVVIEVTDDGRGIERAAVAAKAVERGIVAREEVERMSDSEVLELIFEPGFSTAEQVTEVSGRGVGLDVVKIVLERLKGTVSIHTIPGRGTTFQLKVPLTLAIIKALLFRVGERMFAVPLGTVLEIARANEGEIHRVDDHDVLQMRDQLLTLVRLNSLGAGPKAAAAAKRKLFVIVVAIAGRRFGLVVDRLVGEEELVIKALDDQLVSTEMVSGASILGNGSVVLILNIAAVVEKLGRIRGVSVEASSGDESGAVENAMGAKA